MAEPPHHPRPGSGRDAPMLDGCKVLDLSQYLAGPGATRPLAEIIKVAGLAERGVVVEGEPGPVRWSTRWHRPVRRPRF